MIKKYYDIAQGRNRTNGEIKSIFNLLDYTLTYWT